MTKKISTLRRQTHNLFVDNRDIGNAIQRAGLDMTVGEERTRKLDFPAIRVEMENERVLVDADGAEMRVKELKRRAKEESGSLRESAREAAFRVEDERNLLQDETGRFEEEVIKLEESRRKLEKERDNCWRKVRKQEKTNNGVKEKITSMRKRLDDVKRKLESAQSVAEEQRTRVEQKEEILDAEVASVTAKDRVLKDSLIRYERTKQQYQLQSERMRQVRGETEKAEKELVL